MKKFLVTLMVLALIVSCGKNNSVSATGPVGIATSPISTINADANFQTLANAINNSSFPTQNTNYYTEYHFGNMVNNCVTKDGWFGIDYQSCSTSISNEVIVYQYQVDINAKKAELNDILRKTVVYQSNGSLSTLRTSDNYTYVIRTDFPIQANPVYKLNNVDKKSTNLLYIR
ncbi:MAG: hypothetical protein Q7U04_02510 [Bacteriovorax sp.]|nr:hypothetical protein [Bacteriovorax sp.]